MVDRGAGMDRLSRNLALVTVPDDAFWEGLQPADLADPTRGSDDLQILRGVRQDGTRRADFNQFTPRARRAKFRARLLLVLNSRSKGRAPVNLSCHSLKSKGSRSQQATLASPSVVLCAVRSGRARSGAFQGLAYFDFVWLPAETPQASHFSSWTGSARV